MKNESLLNIFYRISFEGQNNDLHSLHKASVKQFKALAPCHPRIHWYEEAPEGCVSALLWSFLFQDREVSSETSAWLKKSYQWDSLQAIVSPWRKFQVVQHSSCSPHKPPHMKSPGPSPQHLMQKADSCSTSQWTRQGMKTRQEDKARRCLHWKTAMERTSPFHGLSWEGVKLT